MYKYLRLSLTPRCNMRCRYCLPHGYVPTPNERHIGEDGMFQIVERLVGNFGLRKIRLTGGEPLIYPNLIPFVTRLAAIPGVDDLAITTNGLLLKRHAKALAEAGVNRVNVSLDTLDREVFKNLTKVDGLTDVLAGISAAQETGLNPVKVNVVSLHGVNDTPDSVKQLLKFAANHNVELRLLEYMPIGGKHLMGDDVFVSGGRMKRMVEDHIGPLTFRGTSSGGTAEMYWLEWEGDTLPVGFVNPVSNPFCVSCGRLRLSSEGLLVRCLRTQEHIDLKPFIDDNEKLDRILAEYLAPKAVRQPFSGNLAMVQIGG